MSEKPSTSRERIIPIEIEGEGDNLVEDEKQKKISTTCLPEPAFSDPPKEVIVPEEALKRTLPMYNVKEKIIIIVDTAEDENFTPFRLNTQQKKPLDMLKHAVEMFLNSKQLINKKHEYALAVLNENNVMWQVNFTNNINEVINALQNVNACETEDIFDLSSLFDVILQNVKVPEACRVEGALLPPPYVVRTILLYGRSYTLPKLDESEKVRELLDSPYFTLDVLMTHEPVDDDNNCNKIFNVLQNLDQKGFAYFFSVARDAKTLHDSVGKLLGHPLQRPIQQLADYSIAVP
jgi:hypothetical protein